MLRKIHQIDIIVNDEPIELYDPEKLNLRINNVLFKPEEMTSKTGEYSFSFEIPATRKNNTIFNFANNMSKLNKFNTLYNCEVNVDGINVFTGTLRLSDTTEDKYICNLISLKVNKIEDIFGDTMMNELDWEIPFKGASTINTVNTDPNSRVYFPLVCYGAFQKRPYATYGNEVNMYTDLLQIDAWNRWYWESFHPSFNLIELVRRCFLHKGYTLNGDILDDNILNNIYLSEYIDSSQDPTYNLNDPDIGKLTVAGGFTASGGGSRSSYGASGTAGVTRAGGVESTGEENSLVRKVVNDLQYPKQQMSYFVSDEYNFAKAFVYDVFATPATDGYESGAEHYFTVSPTNSYLYRRQSNKNSSGFIVIPADGLYRINFHISELSLINAFSGYNIVKYKQGRFNGNYGEPGIDYDEIDVSDPSTWTFDRFPVEVQLVRNTDEPELIWTAGNVINREYQTSYTNEEAGMTQYPHETNSNALMNGGKKGTTGGVSASGGHTYGGNRSYANLGDRYYVDKGTTIAYDPKVNEGFLMGFTTENRSCAVLKNGRSWDPTVGVFNQTHYRQPGYKKSIWSGQSKYSGSELTDHNKNSLTGAEPDSFSYTSNVCSGRITAVMELKKNDRISIKVITKALYELTTGNSHGSGYRTSTVEWGSYPVSFRYGLTIFPYTPDTTKYVNAQTMRATPSEEDKKWGVNLKLGNFLNAKEKMSDFINNFIKTFNLQYNQIGKNVFINKNKLDMTSIRSEVDIDDRVKTSEGQASRIDYPGTMQVKWSIADDEAGAYRSIDTVEHQGANNWKDYIDRGSDEVQMDTTNESKSESVESKWSYTWYQDFTLYGYNKQTGNDNGHIATLRIPLIAKDEDFIIQSDDSMSKDGLSLKQRLWFRDGQTSESLELWNGSAVSVTLPTDEYNGCTLNFRNEQGSLLDRYFNVTPRTDSNYLTVECYLTPQEYLMLKNGAFTKFDDDLYLVSEIQGYDPSGVNKTELILIKKV